MEEAVRKKVCVITGGGSGMGLATARRMVKKGYYTILCGPHVFQAGNGRKGASGIGRGGRGFSL